MGPIGHVERPSRDPSRHNPLHHLFLATARCGRYAVPRCATESRQVRGDVPFKRWIIAFSLTESSRPSSSDSAAVLIPEVISSPVQLVPTNVRSLSGLPRQIVHD